MARQQCGQVVVKQVADALHRQVRGRTCGNNFCVVGILTLTRKNGGHAVTQDFLDGGQYAWLIVHQDIVLSWVAPLDVIQRLFLVNIDQNVVVEGRTRRKKEL